MIPLPPVSLRCLPNALVLSTATKAGRLIGWYTGKWTHVELFNTVATTVGAVWEGVRETTLERALEDTRVAAVVSPIVDWRLAYDAKERLERYQEYLAWAIRKNIPYDSLAVASFKRYQRDGAVCCSEFGFFGWDELLAGLDGWNLPGRRLKMPAPADLMRVGIMLWASDWTLAEKINKRTVYNRPTRTNLGKQVRRVA